MIGRNLIRHHYDKFQIHQNFFSTSGLAWKASLKRTKVRLDLLTDIDRLLMVEKCIREQICHAIHRYVKTNNKYMKDYDKKKESLYLKYWAVNNLFGWTMSQNFPLIDFEWVK